MKQLVVTKAQLWDFLLLQDDDEQDSLDKSLVEALKQCDIKQIIAAHEMSEEHLGGDDLVKLADDILAAQAEGYKIVTWYGHDAETLVAGYRPEQLTVQDGGVSGWE